MKKILVPTDFSSDADNALDFAIKFNEKYNAEIVLMHVLELPAASVNYGADMTSATAEVIYRRELIDGISKNLHKRADKVRASGQEAAIRIEYGSPYKSIGEEVKEERADWVILGSRGASGLKEVFVGSNAEKVIRHSKCPVITIQEPADLEAMTNLVYASDMRPEGDSVAQQVKEFQKMFDLKVHLVKVKTPYNFISDEVARKEMAEFVKRNDMADFTTNVVEAEFADQGVVEFAEGIHAGMIAMGTHGRTGIAHFLGGSQAEDVANHAAIPVLTFRIGS